MTPTAHDLRSSSRASTPLQPLVGVEWVVEALGCDPDRLRDELILRDTCDRLLAELELHVIGSPQWHTFPDPGGVTGLYLLTESHLACHTYPEYELATFNLYCCRPRSPWPWDTRLGEAIGAKRVVVRTVSRGAFAEPNPPARFPEMEGRERGQPPSSSPSLLRGGSGQGFPEAHR